MREKQLPASYIATKGASWRALIRALRGNALAMFPPKAFADDVVVERFLGHRQVHFSIVAGSWSKLRQLCPNGTYDPRLEPAL